MRMHILNGNLNLTIELLTETAIAGFAKLLKARQNENSKTKNVKLTRSVLLMSVLTPDLMNEQLLLSWCMCVCVWGGGGGGRGFKNNMAYFWEADKTLFLIFGLRN